MSWKIEAFVSIEAYYVNNKSRKDQFVVHMCCQRILLPFGISSSFLEGGGGGVMVLIPSVVGCTPLNRREIESHCCLWSGWPLTLSRIHSTIRKDMLLHLLKMFELLFC